MNWYIKIKKSSIDYYGYEIIEIPIKDEISDYKTLKELLISKELSDGFYIVFEDVVKVKNNTYEVMKDLYAHYDHEKNEFIIIKRDYIDPLYRAIYHGTDKNISFEDLKPGKIYGRWGINEYEAIYFQSNPENRWGKNIIKAYLKPEAKLIDSSEARKTVHEEHMKSFKDSGYDYNIELKSPTQILIDLGYDAVYSLNNRGDFSEIAVLNKEAIEEAK